MMPKHEYWSHRERREFLLAEIDAAGAARLIAAADIDPADLADLPDDPGAFAAGGRLDDDPDSLLSLRLAAGRGEFRRFRSGSDLRRALGLPEPEPLRPISGGAPEPEHAAELAAARADHDAAAALWSAAQIAFDDAARAMAAAQIEFDDAAARLSAIRRR